MDSIDYNNFTEGATIQGLGEYVAKKCNEKKIRSECVFEQWKVNSLYELLKRLSVPKIVQTRIRLMYSALKKIISGFQLELMA